jgi:hypothetical protein
VAYKIVREAGILAVDLPALLATLSTAITALDVAGSAASAQAQIAYLISITNSDAFVSVNSAKSREYLLPILQMKKQTIQDSRAWPPT